MIKAIHEHGAMRRRLAHASECELGTICNQQAVDLCVQVVEIASENAEAITDEEPTISTTCDVALIDETGFHWKHGPTCHPASFRVPHVPALLVELEAAQAELLEKICGGPTLDFRR